MHIVWTAVSAAAIIGLIVAALILYEGAGFCVPGESAIACIREWTNPVAAIFTVLAIGFAALQVTESARQSDAAVRSNLVAIRHDLLQEIAFMKPYLDIGAIQVWKDMVLAGVPGTAQPWHSMAGKTVYDELSRLSPLPLYSTDMRHNAEEIEAARAQVRMKQQALARRMEAIKNLYQSGADPFANTSLFWGFRSDALALHSSVSEYRKHVVQELSVVADTIREIDSRVLSKARLLNKDKATAGAFATLKPLARNRTTKRIST